MLRGSSTVIFEAFDVISSWFQNMVVRTLFSPTISMVLLIEVLLSVPRAFIPRLLANYMEEIESDDRGCFSICMTYDEEDDDDDATKEFKELVHADNMGLDDQKLKRSVMDLKRWIDSVNKIKTLNHFSELFSKSPPSQELLASFLHSAKGRYKVSSLSIIVLMKVATIFIPSKMSQSLFNSFD
ncbi:hypothetical protein Sjap_015353 [Stephania japonica]|uniref:Uncharacterized protein n=1 Tax=Stephania japonica TaxID=461633 RepID=A0AAP0IIY9_9MAGN